MKYTHCLFFFTHSDMHVFNQDSYPGSRALISL
jgi:hypothetical protein